MNMVAFTKEMICHLGFALKYLGLLPPKTKRSGRIEAVRLTNIKNCKHWTIVCYSIHSTDKYAWNFN